MLGVIVTKDTKGGAVATTIADVARAAGVSPSTVSRALSGGPVNAVTRESVMRAVSHLGYQPNRAARELTTGRTGAFGVLVPDLSNPYFADVIKGASSRARMADHPIFVTDSDEDRAREHEIVESLRRNTDAVLLCSPRSTDDEVAEMAARGPTVVVNRHVAGVPAVIADATSGVEQAVQHLGALGHRLIAYVTGPEGSWTERQRRIGLEAAVVAGIDVVYVPALAPTFESGVLAADVILTTGATAVIAFNDLIALGVLNRLTSRGVRVPDDVSLVGHDDIAMASMSMPQLTTVAVQKERLGSMAMELLLRLVGREFAAPERARSAELVTLPATLMVRQSTAVAPAGTASRSMPA